MLKLCLLAFLLIFIHSEEVILALSDATTTIANFDNSPSVYADYRNTNNPDYLNVGAVWIGNPVNPNAQVSYIEHFQKLFQADCTSAQAKINVTAKDYYSVIFNGALLTSNTFPTISTLNVNLICGVNNLTVVVMDLRDPRSTPSGLIFSIAQDQSSCYDCVGVRNFYNRYTCQCDNLISTNPLCVAPKIWNNITSICQCHPDILVFARRTCFAPRMWNSQICTCQCPQNIQCQLPKTQNNQSCGCECPASTVCRFPLALDNESCNCRCSSVVESLCYDPKIFYQQNCSCRCPAITCPPSWRLNSTTCLCFQRHPELELDLTHLNQLP